MKFLADARKWTFSGTAVAALGLSIWVVGCSETTTPKKDVPGANEESQADNPAGTGSPSAPAAPTTPSAPNDTLSPTAEPPAN